MLYTKFNKQFYTTKFDNVRSAERPNLSKLTQEKINNQNSSISVKEIQFRVKNLCTKKTLSSGGLIGIKHFKKKLYQLYTKSSRKLKGKDYSQVIL